MWRNEVVGIEKILYSFRKSIRVVRFEELGPLLGKRFPAKMEYLPPVSES